MRFLALIAYKQFWDVLRDALENMFMVKISNVFEHSLACDRLQGWVSVQGHVWSGNWKFEL